ncbi:hypothetical protein PIB30_026452 [Stylosanthes scabra]|uniref:Uncharacterized protein n=1 Tax=Stylosanthes scabra TaxID=79078 RepID=A0ABU6V8Q4_9FABA|nr:hypothetical protein [Stylosanthes scabra]
MRQRNRLRSRLTSHPSATQQQVEVVDIDDDLSEFPSETTPNPIATPNLTASQPEIPESPSCIVKRTPKGRVKKSARRTPTKQTTTSIPGSQAESEPETQNHTLPQPPSNNEHENSGAAEVESQPPSDNASQRQASRRQYERKRRASYKRPAPTGQSIVQGGKCEAPKIFVPRPSSGEESDSDSDLGYHQYESEELHSPYSSEGEADSDNDVWLQ